ncbi:Glucosyltransferase-like protein [Tulasnella sp. 419]|nr:Glucosyltransferase-like protein [Tulasnella sp. 419]
MDSLPEERYGRMGDSHSLRVRTLKATPKRSASVTSAASARSRAESETDYEEILAPKPRHSYAHLLQPWLYNYEAPTTPATSTSPGINPVAKPMSPLRSPPNPYLHSRNFSLPANLQVSQGKINQSRQAGSDADHVKFAKLDRTDSMARRWVKWMAKVGMRDWVVPLTIAGNIWVKWAVGLGPYSGYATPPIYGDFEAQRHWMELTLHLPAKEWYSYSSGLWELDYPPLTAYVSYLCGVIGNAVNPSWFAFKTSKGFESPEHKVFMRGSVIVMDLLIYIPALWWFSRLWWHNRSRRTQQIALLTTLFQPALLLIDNGHFQYNSVMLGFTVLAIDLFHSGHNLLGAIAFVCSLCFKQMALYYSPAIFAYLLGRCLALPSPRNVILLSKIAAVTISTFIILFSPWIFKDFPNLLIQSVIRIFPFNRGLFEDKVANFWCATNVVVKWRRRFDPKHLPKLATFLTFLGILPPMVHMLGVSLSLRGSRSEDPITNPVSTSSSQRPIPTRIPSNPPRSASLPPKSAPSTARPFPTIQLLPWALFNSSLAFFLFSFQVHEKSILLPLLPLTLLMDGRSEIDEGVGTWEWGVLVNNVAMFSMWPLLQREKLALQYTVVTLLWNYLIGYNPIQIPSSFVKFLSLFAYAAIGGLHCAEWLYVPPARYPHLFPVLNVLLCSSIYGIAYLWGMKKQLEAGWAVAGLGEYTKSEMQSVTSSPAPPPPLKLSEAATTYMKNSGPASAGPHSPSRFLSVNEGDAASIRARKRRSMPAGSNVFLNAA